MIDTPTIDWAGLSPYLAVPRRSRADHARRRVFAPERRATDSAPSFRHHRFAGAGAAAIVLLRRRRARPRDHRRRDPARPAADLAQILIVGAGLLAVLVAFRERDAEPSAAAEYYVLLLSAVGGMAFFVAANDLITLFLGLEWFSISLYILCA